MNNIVEFPPSDRPEHQWTESEVDEIHAEAFRDLEGSICDCLWMSVIALEMVERAIDKGRDDKHEMAMFAVCESVIKLKKLKANYYAAWHGEKQDQDMPAGEQTAQILRKFHALKPSYQKIISDWIETAAAEDNASA